ncbi:MULTISPECIES: LVIVD repeat-containing protein [unclassified Luteimonas]
MKPNPFLTAALAAAMACTLAAGVEAAEPLKLKLLRGGGIAAAPVVSGALAYVPTGRVIATWDYARPDRPVRLDTSDAVGGPINGLVRVGDHLYASWRGDNGRSGVATWSLADPRVPRLVRDDEAYLDSDRTLRALGLTTANDHLYLFDDGHGLLVGKLDDPEAPVFAASAVGSLPAQFTDLAVHGDTIHASGRGWLGNTVYTLYDVSAPGAPVVASSHGLDGLDTFRVVSGPETTVGIGNNLSVFDTAAGMAQRGSIEIPAATAGARLGDHVYSFGYGPGMGIWNVADPDAPQAVAQSTIDAFAGRRAVPLGEQGMLLQTGTDLMHALDVGQPGKPQLVATGWLPGGVRAVDAAIHDGKTVLLQANYGLTVNDPDTLAPLARVEAGLPKLLEGRSFEQMAMAGDIAWMAAWGYGLVAVDLGAQGGPKEVSRLPYQFAATIAIEGTRAWVGRWTNEGGLATVDIAKPGAPALLSEIPLANQPYRLHAGNGYLYMAQGAQIESGYPGGMIVFDVSGSGAPRQLAHVDDGCGAAFDLAVDEAMDLAYLACGEGLRVVDIANPAAPEVIGRYSPGSGLGDYTRVAQAGELVWFADAEGLHELDVSDPTSPELRKLTSLGGAAPQRLLATGDQRLLALGGDTGVHVLGPDARLLRAGETVRGLSGAEGDSFLFAVRVPAGVRNLTVLRGGGGGSGQLRIESRHQAVPEDGAADGSTSGRGLRIQAPEPGLHYIRVTGLQAFAGVSLYVVF